MDFWCTDKPCWGKNGTSYHMGRNGQVVGEMEHYGDHVYTTEAMRIISEHDLQVPLYFYIAFQCNHEPLEAPDDFVELYPESYRQDRRWCTTPRSAAAGFRSADALCALVCAQTLA